MTTIASIKKLNTLEHVLSDINQLLFKAHVAIPLTLQPEQESQLMRQINRLAFRYQQLQRQKTKLIQQLSAVTQDYVYTTVKWQRLKMLDDQKGFVTLDVPRQKHGQKERLAKLIQQLQAEKVEENTVLVRQILTYYYHHEQADFLESYQPLEQLNVVSDSRTFKIDLMELNYLDVYFTEPEIKQYVQFLAYKYSGQKARGVIFFDARQILKRAELTGFSAVAYYFIFDQQNICFISFKGTEGTMDDPNIPAFNQRLDNYVRENYLDWQYNIDAMMLGNTQNDEQLGQARRFCKYVVEQANLIDLKTVIYGLGHSLGGHFVQTLQLLDAPFTAGYTLNAAPVQLKQIYHYQPTLFEPDIWDKLFIITQVNTQNHEIEKQLFKYLGRDYHEIENEWFRQDITRIYFCFPNTFYIGTHHYLDTKNWDYPFITNVSGYLSDEDIAVYSQFFGNLIAHMQQVDKQNAATLLTSLLTYTWQSLKEVYNALQTPKAKRIFEDYTRYFYDAKIFTEMPELTSENLKPGLSKPRLAINILKNDWPFINSLNHDMVETVTYFHTIIGAKHLK